MGASARLTYDGGHSSRRYGDPLRVKATPDMSLRFLDEAYATENKTIADIQARLMAYYQTRL